MTVDLAIGFCLSLSAMGYVCYAMLRPERFS